MSAVLGLPELLSKMGRFQVEAEVGEKVAEASGAGVVAADMRRRAPVDTGSLRASIVVQPAEHGARVVVGVPYGRFVQFGTRYMDAEPFISDQVNSPVIAAMKRVFQAIFR